MLESDSDDEGAEAGDSSVADRLAQFRPSKRSASLGGVHSVVGNAAALIRFASIPSAAHTTLSQIFLLSVQQQIFVPSQTYPQFSMVFVNIQKLHPCIKCSLWV